MTDFYRMDPGAWDFGTAGLTLEEEAAYLRIINAIHKHKGPVPNKDRVLAGMFRVSLRKARALVAALADAGKITIDGDLIWNERARSDLVQRGFVSMSRAESGAKGGRTRGENAAKALKEKEASQAIPSSREEKRREEKQQPREEVPSSQAETDRERLLAAMGADPRSGLIGPNGRRLGTVADTTEAGKWSAMGISLDQQCAVIAERCAAMRRNNPHWTPGRFAYFSGAMADFAATRDAPIPAGNAKSQSERDAKMSRYDRIARGAA